MADGDHDNGGEIKKKRTHCQDVAPAHARVCKFEFDVANSSNRFDRTPLPAGDIKLELENLLPSLKPLSIPITECTHSRQILL